MTQDRIYTWQDGLPTGPDVQILMSAYPDLQPGTRIEYAEVEAKLGLKWDSRRFATVTKVWRERQLKLGVVVDCIPGKAFLVLQPAEITAGTYGVLEQVGRSVRNQRRKLGTIKGVDHLRDHQARLMAELERETRKTRMSILPGPSPVAPQIGPPQDKQA